MSVDVGNGEDRILIVDDDESIRATLVDAFRDDGYDVDAAGSTRAALEAVDREPPDVIVLDMRMPDDGPVFEAELKRRSYHVPIIAMSANVEGQRWASDIGARFVKKPFVLDELFAEVREALEEAAA